jgi:hypothetical protein
MIIERVESGFAISPDARFTEVNDDFAALAGVYGGWMVERRLLVGAGGYWLANGSDAFKMTYGGAVVEWLVHGERRIGFGARALIGGGSATISGPLGELFDLPADGRFDAGSSRAQTLHTGRGGSPIRFNRHLTGETPVVVREDFFVTEPQGTVFWRVTRWFRIDAGVGYRLIGAAGDLNDRLRGVSGSLSVQFGGG